MKKEILRCITCKNYTLKKICPKCGGKVISPKPAKYSLLDKYGKYRRLAKKDVGHTTDKQC